MPKICYTPKNFNRSSQEKIDICNVIINEYAAQGFDLTLRQLYYQLVSRDYIPNNIREYKNLGNLVNDARLAGQIDWNRIVDRTRNLQRLPTWDSPADIIKSAAYSYRIDLWEGQEYQPEVWIEKNALIGVIGPVCERLRIPYFACVGYTSQSEMWSAAQRLRSYITVDNRIPVIFHLGDHDPSGIDMTRDIQERLDLFIGTDMAMRRSRFSGVQIERLALNIDQINQYNPPPNPAKLTDSRSTVYIRDFGYESWELDALDPATISNLIETAVLRYRNEDTWYENRKIEDNNKILLDKTAKLWDSDIADFVGLLDDDEEEDDYDDGETEEETE